MTGTKMKFDILLLRPKGRATDSRIFAMEQLGLSYIAGVARDAGLSVKIVDGFLCPELYDEVLSDTKTGDYYLIGYPIYQESIRRVGKDVCRLRENGVETHICVGNYLATMRSETVLEDFPQFNSAIRGEGEYTVTELTQCIKKNVKPTDVLGLTYRDENRIVSNPPRPNTLDLDTIPFPVRDTLDIVIKAGNAPLIYSSRGCNARCEFCAVHKFYNASPNGRWRARSASNVVDEMQAIATRFGVNDEEFMGHGRIGAVRAVAIADEIIARKLNYEWYIETRSADVKRDVFERMAAGGLRAVFMGVESGYDPALTAFKKGIRVSQHLEAIQILKDLEILSSVGFIMYRPDTSLEEITYNLDFLEHIGCAEVTALVTKMRVYAGTDTEIRMKAKGSLIGDYQNYDWKFQDTRVAHVCEIAVASADTFYMSSNQFARLRRSGLHTFDECLQLQRVLNSGPLNIMRAVVREVASGDYDIIELAEDARHEFKQACDNFMRVFNFTRTIASSRPSSSTVKLLNPMSLC